MNAIIVTMCPTCGTCFNVSQSQLDAAEGAVRCGACLLVFQAEEHLSLDSDQAIQPAEETEEMEETEETPETDETYTPDLFIDSSNSSSLEGFDGALDLAAEAPQDIVGPVLPSRSGSNLLWVMLSGFLIISIAMQYLWVNRQILAQDEQWRPHYLSVCRYLDCDLVPFNDIEQLSTVNLLVRSHQSVSGALAVDVHLKNRGAYPQPFPLLQLDFSDKAGRMVAARTFDAAEYLAGEMKGIRMIPASTVIRLSLALVDPGPEAVGYSIRVID